MTITEPEASSLVAAPRLSAKRVALVALVAAVVNLVIFAIGSAADAFWGINGGTASSQTVNAFFVVMATIVPFAVGLGTTALLMRKWSAAPRWMAWIGLGFAVLSVGMPLASADETTTGVALAAMHVVAGLAWFAAIYPRARR